MKKILILMSKTGGGHYASASALETAFRQRYGAQFHVDIVDLWMDHTPWPLNQVPRTYRYMVDGVPWLWELIYRAGENPLVSRPMLEAAWGWTRRPVRQAIEKHDPDLILSVHALLQEIPLRVLARMHRTIPFVTVITDLISIHPTWFNRKVTLCFVASEEAHRLGLEAGLRPAQLRQHGLPIRPAFAAPSRPRDALREALGLTPDLPAVLLVSGGEGMGPVEEIAEAVSARLAADGRERGQPVGQLVVVCGRNRKLHDQLSARDWPIPTLIRGFVDNMWDWMRACDCIVTKAGPGTIAEALACGLPILLSGYIPGQEEGNVTYVVKHGVGAYSSDPQQMAEIISLWFGPEREQMALMAENAQRLGNPQATFEIVEDIAALLT
jgi:1,2-diacylglycerol 3-beta-galactosyltransferase